MTIPESPYGPSAVAATPAPIPAVRPRRGLGTAALVLALIPIAVTVAFIVIAIVAGVVDDSGWAVLGWAILGVYVSVPLGLILGGTAVGLGIAAVIKNRGRGAGIVGIVAGGLSVLAVLGLLAVIFQSALF